MKTIETKVKIDKELLEKVKEYKINIEAFLDTGFRRYVDYVVYKDKLEKHRDDIDTDYLTKGFSKTELKELTKHLETEDTGKFDIDIITTGLSHTQQSRMRSIIDIIQKLCDASEDGNADRNDIIREAEIDGVESDKVEDAVDRLRRNGQIYEASHGKYRLSDR